MSPVQYADLIALAPFLCPRVQPRSLIDCDLKAWKAGATAGTQDQLDTRLERVAAQTTQCSVCGRRGAAVTGDGDEGSDEERETAAADAKSELRFTTQWRLQVQDRECQLTGGSFCCGMCRTCMDIGAFVQFCSFRAGRPECREWCVSRPELSPMPALACPDLALPLAVRPVGCVLLVYSVVFVGRH